MAKGLTTGEALTFTTRHLTQISESGLRKVVSTLRSTARKRYERIVEAEVYSPALDYLVRSAKGDVVLPSVRGMDAVDLRNEYKRLKHFLNLKTSTVKGAKTAKETMTESFKQTVGVDLSEQDVTELWRTVDELKNGEFGGIFNYKDMVSAVADIIAEYNQAYHEYTPAELMATARRRLQQIYEDENAPNRIYTSQFM